MLRYRHRRLHNVRQDAHQPLRYQVVRHEAKVLQGTADGIIMYVTATQIITTLGVGHAPFHGGLLT